MKKNVLLLLLMASVASAQQLPDFTQFRSNLVMLNPAVAGTKRFIDARIDYHQQWVGFDGAPTTQSLSVNSRLLKGLMGVGGILYNDATGPTRRLTYGLDYAFHIRFPDVELSLGARGSMTKYYIDGSKITVRNPGDRVVDEGLTNASVTEPNISAGLYFYNDRFHIGVSALNFVPTKYEYYKDPLDTGRKASFPLVMHNYFSMGYNYSNDYDFIWQNSVLASYLQGAPISIAYNLTLRIKEKLLIGATVRFGDAVGLNAGFVITDEFEAHYSYDYIYSNLRASTSGTHEVMLVYSFNTGTKRGRSEGFQHQKYRYLF